jgi:hypothetical protein
MLIQERCRSAPLKTLRGLGHNFLPEEQMVTSLRIGASHSHSIKSVTLDDKIKNRSQSYSFKFQTSGTNHQEKRDFFSAKQKERSRLGNYNLVKTKMRSISTFTGQEFSLIDFGSSNTKNSKEEPVLNRILKREIQNKVFIDNNIILDYSLKKEFEKETIQKRTKRFRENIIKKDYNDNKRGQSAFFPITNLNISKLQNNSHGKLRISKIYAEAQKETLDSFYKCIERGQSLRFMMNSFLQSHDQANLILHKISK